MPKEPKDLEEFPSKEGPRGQRVYYYSGNWRTASAIRTIRADARLDPAERAERAKGRAQVRHVPRAETLIAGLRDGKTWAEVADELGITRQQLYNSVHASPAPVQSAVKRAQASLKEDQGAIAKRLAKYLLSGYSYEQIADEEDWTVSVVTNKLHELRASHPQVVPSSAAVKAATRERKAKELGKLYTKHGNYAAIAEATGRSPLTVGVEYRKLRAEFPELMPEPKPGRTAK